MSTRKRRRTEAAPPPRLRARTWVLLGILAVLALFWGIRSALRPDLPRLLEQAKKEAHDGNSPQAIAQFDRLLRYDPFHGEALIYRGQLARDQGDAAAAGAYWQQVADQPEMWGGLARYFEATVCLEQGRAREAEQLLLRASMLRPDYLPPRERLVELYVAQMRRDDVRRQLDVIFTLRPWKLNELVLYQVIGERVTAIEEGRERMRQFVAADPDDLHSVVALARYHLEDDQFLQAAEVLQAGLRQHPQDDRLRGWLAEAFYRLNELRQMGGALSGIADATAAGSVFWRSCGRYWSEQGEPGRAVDCLRRAVAFDPEDLAAQHQLGLNLNRLGETSDAARHLEQAELLDRLIRQAFRIPRRGPQHDQLLFPIVTDIAETLVKLERPHEAAAWFYQALQIQPQDLTAQRNWQQAQIHLVGAARSPGKSAASKTPTQAELAALLPKTESLSPPREPAPTRSNSSPIQLVDQHLAAGIDFQFFNGQTGLKYLVESMGGAVAVLDFDGDGWPDLYFAQGCRLPFDDQNREHRDRLYRNLGNGKFADVTEASGLGDHRYGQGCAAADYDNDGDPDLVVANFGPDAFYRNNGDGTFTQITEEAGLKTDKWSSSVGFGDLDRDGNLDLYVVTYVDSLRVCHGEHGEVATCDPQNFGAEQDVLYRNRGDGTLEDISQSAGIRAPDGKGLGLVIADLDDDQWPDIYVANDGTPNFLFRNLGESGAPLAFSSEGLVSGTAVDGSGQAEGSMGIACADFNHDGQLDLYVTNFYLEMYTLYLNQGNMFFADGTQASGLAGPTKYVLGFGTQAVDLDADGQVELMVANGHIDDYRARNIPWKMKPQLFRGAGPGTFEDISLSGGDYFAGEYLGRGVARWDWDRDGNVDLVVVHQDRPVALLHNETQTPNRKLVIELHGTQSNRDGIGARLRVTAGERTQVLEKYGGDGFFATNEGRQFVGIGAASSADLEIRWPSGRVERLTGVPGNSRVVLCEGGNHEFSPL